jgi:Calcineurin-like phosphoesterase
MKRLDRRNFLRLSAMSLGSGVLLQFMPRRADAGWLDHMRRRNGESPGPFSIVQLSDTHVGFNGPPDPLGTAAFERAVEMVNRLDPQPDLILFTGDLTHDIEDPVKHAERMRKLKEIESKLRVQTRYHVPGEHDAALDKGVLFRDNFVETHYSFDHKGVHFVVLDNVSHPKGILGDAQIDWLSSDLKALPAGAPIVVFTHRPLFDLKADWDWTTADGSRAIDVLHGYPHVTVFYGHIHQEHHHQTDHIAHHAARSLVFPLPVPGSQPNRAPVPWDPAHPGRGLGFRDVDADPREAAYQLREIPLAAET